MEIMLTKVSLKPNFLTTRMQKLLGWFAKVICTRIILQLLQQLKLTDEKLLLDSLPNVRIMGKWQ